MTGAVRHIPWATSGTSFSSSAIMMMRSITSNAPWRSTGRPATGGALWSQGHFSGGGFPGGFDLRDHGYPKFFPLWAVARYRNLKAGNSRHVAHGL